MKQFPLLKLLIVKKVQFNAKITKTSSIKLELPNLFLINIS